MKAKHARKTCLLVGRNIRTQQAAPGAETSNRVSYLGRGGERKSLRCTEDRLSPKKCACNLLHACSCFPTPERKQRGIAILACMKQTSFQRHGPQIYHFPCTHIAANYTPSELSAPSPAARQCNRTAAKRTIDVMTNVVSQVFTRQGPGQISEIYRS